MPEQPLNHPSQLVLNELKALRKRPDGVCVAAISLSPAISQLLGNGDPLVAWSRLQQLAMGTEPSREIEWAPERYCV
ncbi:hypothetical protein [Mycobacterium szulgai]|uniref:hypothetical protein n=1 Tax=Mycobacterium szulgai TaxID=1787 RepID=UPI00111BE13B|nr:hypothetical protein [Mycobacterium szulgai]MCV7079211.1 hypothetical protein [Mycobacterium szulgai]